MKNGSNLVLSFGFFVVVLSCFLINQENNRLKVVNSITNKQVDLLKDQLKEYEMKITTTRTYDQGYSDAIIKSGGRGNYSDGFEAARTIYENEDAKDGYHRAIAQFGYCPLNTKIVETSSIKNRDSENDEDGK